MDNPGRLTEAQNKQFVEWLERDEYNHVCPVCGTSGWQIGAHFLENKAIKEPDAKDSAVYPMAFVVCRQCAYVRQFMAVAIGLLPENGKIE